MLYQEITGELVHQDGDIYFKSGDSLLYCVFPDNLLDKAVFCLRNHNEVTLCGILTENQLIKVQSIGVQEVLAGFNEEF